MMWQWLPLILLGVALNSAAQIVLKYGAAPISQMALSISNAPAIARNVLKSGYFWIGLALYAVSFVNWVFVLSRVDVSAAYPLLSLGYIVSALWGYFGFREPMNRWRVIGIALIIIGTFFISQS